MNQTVDFRHLMSEAKFYESYSRCEESYESWEQSVTRVMDMHRSKYAHCMTDELSEMIDFAESAYLQKRILGAQRALQFGGEQIMKHNLKMYNCVSSHCNRPEFFGEFMYMLLCGAGAGASIQRHHIDMLPTIRRRKRQAQTFIVEDSIEGWAEAVDILMSSYFDGGGKHSIYAGRPVHFDTSKIRPKGAKISGGFLAPGPEPLLKALGQIESLIERELRDRMGEKFVKLRPIAAYDICMFAADAVISGGVRRSATIFLFSHDDEDMLNAKTGNWFIENPQRGRSNNSAMILRDEVTREEFAAIMKKIKGFGEPGFIFTDNPEFTYNPCVEIGKLPYSYSLRRSGWQGCNL